MQDKHNICAGSEQGFIGTNIQQLLYKRTNCFTDKNKLTYKVFNVPFCNNIRDTLKKYVVKHKSAKLSCCMLQES